MNKRLLTFIFIFILMFSVMHAQAASTQMCAPSVGDLFSVEYYDENIVPGAWYSFIVLKPDTDFAQMTPSDILYMKQVLADDEKTIAVSDFALKKYEASEGAYGDVYLGGSGLSFSCLAVLMDHDCADSSTYHDAVSATCEEDGTLEYWECNECGRKFDNNTKQIIEDITEKGGHKTAFVAAIKAECTQDGNIEHYKCLRPLCNGLFADENAQQPYTENDVVIAKLNHKNKITKEASLEATCANPGHNAHTYCPDCKKYFSDAACTEEMNENDVLITVQHTLGEVFSRKEPTCTENGQVAHYTCSACTGLFEDEELSIKLDSVTIPATGHSWNETGSNAFTCTVCSAVRYVIGSGDMETEIYTDNIDSVLTDGEKEQGYSVEIKGEMLSSPSAAIKNKITSMNLGNNEAFAVDISILKGISEVTQEVTQTTQPLKLEIALPDSIDVRDNYYVLRLHQDNVQTIGETANSDGEYFAVDKENNCITIYANKFSEYVIISEEEPRIGTGIGNGGTSTNSGGTGGTGGTGGGSDKNEDKPQEEIVLDEEATKYNFADISENDWYYEAVCYASKSGLMKGVSTESFAPNDNITRAMFVTILHRMENEPSVKASRKFSDVKSGEWYYDAVSWASEKAIVSGVDSNDFAPDAVISREQLATMLYRYAIYKRSNISAAENTSLTVYEDAGNVSSYALSAIKWAVGENIINGKTQATLNPQDSATRAETAALLMRIADKLS